MGDQFPHTQSYAIQDHYNWRAKEQIEHGPRNAVKAFTTKAHPVQKSHLPPDR